MSRSTPLHTPSDLRAAAALFAIEEVGDVLDRLESVKTDLRAEIRAETQSAVLEGMKNVSQQQESIINDSLTRLKIKASFLEPRQYSQTSLMGVALISLLAGILLGTFIAKTM